MLLEWFGTLHCALSRFVNGEHHSDFLCDLAVAFRISR